MCNEANPTRTFMHKWKPKMNILNSFELDSFYCNNTYNEDYDIDHK